MLMSSVGNLQLSVEKNATNFCFSYLFSLRRRWFVFEFGRL